MGKERVRLPLCESSMPIWSQAQCGGSLNRGCSFGLFSSSNEGSAVHTAARAFCESFQGRPLSPNYQGIAVCFAKNQGDVEEQEKPTQWVLEATRGDR